MEELHDATTLGFFIEKLVKCKSTVELLGTIEVFKLSIYMDVSEAYKRDTKEQK